MINKYLSNLQDLINLFHDEDLYQYSNSKAEAVSFDDLVWYHHDSSHRKTRILCGVIDNFRRQTDKSLTIDFALPHPYSHLLKVYIIYVFADEISTKQKLKRIIEARHILSGLSGNHLYSMTETDFQSIFSKMSSSNYDFIKFCKTKSLIKSNLTFIQNIKRDRTGEKAIASQNHMLPNENSIIAMADIFHEVFKNVDKLGVVKPGTEVDIGDAFTITMACLALASPNRAKAEQLTLSKQRLKKQTKGSTTVYSLDYKGSKNFKDNSKHILSVMAPVIEKSVNYFYHNGEKARILCSFFFDPKQTLKKLTQNFTISKNRLVNLNLSTIPNMFQLGYALGFYKIDQTVYVANKSLKNKFNEGLDIYSKLGEPNKSRHSIYKSSIYKYLIKRNIYQLADDDLIFINRFQSKYNAHIPLFNYMLQNEHNSIFSRGLYTIADIQHIWIDYITNKVIPEFPLSFGASENNVDLRFALFAITGSERPSVGGLIGSNSHYYILSISTLNGYITNRLGKNGHDNIFSKYGYSSELGLSTHMLRHYNNTLADLSDIPISIITAWSGRKNAEQTHTYIHTDGEFKSERINNITQLSTSDNIDIRVKSADEVLKLANTPATITSTGVCTQNLNVTPCEYLNDFIAHCFLCPEACYIAGDEKAITLLDKDCKYQQLRLESVTTDLRIKNSQAMQQWFKLHSSNTQVLSQLISLMKEQTKGNVIKYTQNKCEFRITNLSTGKVTNVKAEISSPDIQLKSILNDNNLPTSILSDNSGLEAIAKQFGISSEDM